MIGGPTATIRRGGDIPMPPRVARVVPGASYDLARAPIPPPARVPTGSGCGNAGAMETTHRFPPRLGNLAQTARFPHFHKPILVGIQKRKNRTQDAVTRDR